MTKFYSLLFALLISTALLAQSPPQSFSYQTVIRDASFNIMANQVVTLKLSIIEDEPQGLMVYQEKHVKTTSAIGLVNLFIGEGNVSSGIFDAIDWANHTYFLEVAIDFDNDDNFIIMGTSQLRSVPYALYALNAGNANQGPAGPQGEQGEQGAPGTNGIDGTDGQGGITNAGTGISVTGAGTSVSPYVVSTSTCGLSIGDTAQGGIIFYLDPSGCHGLVCALTDQSSGIRWYAGSYGNTQAKGDGIYAGKTNTAIIIASQVAIGDDNSTYAARMCNELQITQGGVTYGDWYLPSKFELNEMYVNLHLQGFGGFANSYYWSSNETGSVNAWRQDFSSGFQFSVNKVNYYDVRAVRAF